MNTDEFSVLLCGLLFTLAGAAAVAVWVWAGLLAWRRPRGAFGPKAGTGPLLAGAAAGAAMGLAGLCGGLLLTAELLADVYFDAYQDLPWWALLFLLAVPVGLVAGPGLTLWGLVLVWRTAEDAAPVPAGGGTPDRTAADPLDAPFAPPSGDR